MSRGRTPLAVVVILALVAVATVLMGTLAAANYAAERARGWARLRTQTAVRADQVATSLALPVWNIDRPQIDRILDGLEAEHDVYAVEVQAAGRAHRRARDDQWRLRPRDGPFGRIQEPLIEESRAIELHGDSIGTLKVWATPRLLEQELRRSLYSILGTIFAADVVLILSLYLVLWRTVLWPLRAIERYADAVKRGAGGEAVQVRGRVFTGELQSLRSSIEAMVGLLDLRYAELVAEVARRRESEDAVRASERKFRDIFDFSPVGIYQARLDGDIVMSNAAFARMLGYDDPKELLALNMSRDVFLDPGLREQLLAQYLAAGFVPRTEGQFKRRDGTPFWAEGVAHVVQDPEGGYIESFVQDISARREAAAALLASEERYRRLFEGIPMPMLIYDLEGLAFLAVNEAAVRQYGYAREELLSLSVPDLAVPGDPYLQVFLAERFAPRPDLVHVGDRQQRRKDGTVVEMDLTSLAIVFDGRPARVMLARDIAAEKHAAAERARLEDSLRRSETMSAMGALVAGVAHEVRNPLFSISASVDALEGELGQREEYAEYAQLLRGQVARLTQLMRDLLDYGKPPAPRMSPAVPGELTRRALRSCASLARERGASLVEDVPADLPTMSVDPGRVEQVFENLLTNALQHTPPGGVVRLSARLAAAGPPAVVFTVEDEGPGIPPGDLPRLFEPFFSRRRGGTGLGLSIIQRIVEAHRGAVAAANRGEGGAVFSVTLPLQSADVAAVTRGR